MRKISILFIIMLFAICTTLKSQDTIDVIERAVEITIPEESGVEKEPVFIVVEENAKFQNEGLEKFRDWVQANLIYPSDMASEHLEGRVIVQFIIDVNGKLVEANVIRGVHPSFDNEALRVVRLSPDWEPAKQDGKPVKQQMVIPVRFEL